MGVLRGSVLDFALHVGQLLLDGRKVASYADVRFILMDLMPGEQVRVDVVRDRVFLGETELSYEVKLQ